MWLHRAVAGKLARDPERVLERARRNLDRLERVHAEGMSRFEPEVLLSRIGALPPADVRVIARLEAWVRREAYLYQ